MNVTDDTNTTAHPTVVQTDNRPISGLLSTLSVFIPMVICILGIVANAVTLLVFRSYKSKKSSATFLLRTLAMVDLLFLVTVLACEVPAAAVGHRVIRPTAGPAIYALHYLHYVQHARRFLEFSTTWMIAVIFLDR